MSKVIQMRKKKKYSDDQLAGMLVDALHDLPDNYLMCRDMRHAWNLDQDYFVEKNKHGRDEIRRTLTCMRCGLPRIERYQHTRWGLEKIGQNYDYKAVAGYQIHGLPRGNKPSVIIQGEQYRRSMEKLAKASRRRKRA